jgi:hypothetical protein
MRIRNPGRSEAGRWIRIDLMRIRIQFRIQGFDDKNLKNTAEKNGYLYDKKLLFSHS